MAMLSISGDSGWKMMRWQRMVVENDGRTRHTILLRVGRMMELLW